MHKTSHLAVSLGALVIASTVGFGQLAEMSHFDNGTGVFISRVANAASGSYQRYPSDQICGAVSIHVLCAIIQDQNKATPETFSFVLRKHDALGPATGSPDITATGILAQGNFTNASFGTGTGPAAVRATVTFPTGGSFLIPAFTGGGAADDLWMGFEAPLTTLWPATDGTSCHANITNGTDLGEQFRASFTGYAGAVGNMGMGWSANLTTVVKADAGGNTAWRMGIRFDQDVLQPFADNPAVFISGATSGLNPNFGYAGIAPDVAAPRNDGLGLRLRSMAPIGSLVTLGYDFSSVGPQNLGVNGNLCLNLGTAILYPVNFITVAPTTTGVLVGPTPAHTSEVVLGPLTGLQSLAGLGNVYAQMGTFDAAATGGIRISTLARFNL